MKGRIDAPSPFLMGPAGSWAVLEGRHRGHRQHHVVLNMRIMTRWEGRARPPRRRRRVHALPALAWRPLAGPPLHLPLPRQERDLSVGSGRRQRRCSAAAPRAAHREHARPNRAGSPEHMLILGVKTPKGKMTTSRRVPERVRQDQLRDDPAASEHPGWRSRPSATTSRGCVRVTTVAPLCDQPEASFFWRRAGHQHEDQPGTRCARSDRTRSTPTSR